MQRNMGTADRLVRGILIAPAATIAAVAAGAATLAGVVLLVLAAIMLVTALTGFCPLYRLFGIDTLGRGRVAHR
ncbi:MAG TPA: DUF2892 domain-containing protein [Gaiellaceae bacterium]|jgi:Protein of unknown function (DUF2892)|nr:DUF2892 domain-containing protein [Gaiellaceae bacterium]